MSALENQNKCSKRLSEVVAAMGGTLKANELDFTLGDLHVYAKFEDTWTKSPKIKFGIDASCLPNIDKFLNRILTSRPLTHSDLAESNFPGWDQHSPDSITIPLSRTLDFTVSKLKQRVFEDWLPYLKIIKDAAPVIEKEHLARYKAYADCVNRLQELEKQGKAYQRFDTTYVVPLGPLSVDVSVRDDLVRVYFSDTFAIPTESAPFFTWLEENVKETKK